MNKTETEHKVIAISTDFFSNNNSESRKLDFGELLLFSLRNKALIIIITALFSVVSVIFALNQPNIYKASVLVSPANESANSLSKLAGQFGGLASIAGVNLGGGGDDKSVIALETIKSRHFIEAFIEKYDVLVPLMAATNWDIKNNVLNIDEKIYDTHNKKWVREVEFPKQPKPSGWEAYQEFKDILNINQDPETGIINISIEFYSPILAQTWLENLVFSINEDMRSKAKIEAEESIRFLNEQLIKTQVSELKNVFSNLIEEQTKTMMVSEIQKEYVFKTIDPANYADDKTKPNRPVLCILGTLFGGFFAMFIVIIKFILFKKEEARRDENNG